MTETIYLKTEVGEDHCEEHGDECCAVSYDRGGYPQCGQFLTNLEGDVNDDEGRLLRLPICKEKALVGIEGRAVHRGNGYYYLQFKEYIRPALSRVTIIREETPVIPIESEVEDEA